MLIQLPFLGHALILLGLGNDQGRFALKAFWSRVEIKDRQPRCSFQARVRWVRS
jgi:hypothetical protein